MNIATFELPVTLDRRRYLGTHSVFNAWRSTNQINVIFVHRGKDAKNPVSGSLDPECKVLSVDLSAAEYDKLWAEIWGQQAPHLTVRLEKNEVRQFGVKPEETRITQND
ncbi:MAG TPA: hypothetical protein VER96_02050 [Polyangiaceae bacterium]|nr:hypothetical protein [Polyangiaceae bacterium]